ncbi:MAG TPA: helix-turn-helix transcriptional regulator [Lacunisphaera sp.]|nr:helix-turn-helix transcriptional regulator [Lacunisphaera sp.]
MPIVVNVDLMLARRKMRLNTLAEKVGITPQNLSVLKTGRAKAIRFSTLEQLCVALECQPGDILSFEAGATPASEGVAEPAGGEVM